MGPRQSIAVFAATILTLSVRVAFSAPRVDLAQLAANAIPNSGVEVEATPDTLVARFQLAPMQRPTSQSIESAMVDVARAFGLTVASGFEFRPDAGTRVRSEVSDLAIYRHGAPLFTTRLHSRLSYDGSLLTVNVPILEREIDGRIGDPAMHEIAARFRSPGEETVVAESWILRRDRALVRTSYAENRRMSDLKATGIVMAYTDGGEVRSYNVRLRKDDAAFGSVMEFVPGPALRYSLDVRLPDEDDDCLDGMDRYIDTVNQDGFGSATCTWDGTLRATGGNQSDGWVWDWNDPSIDPASAAEAVSAFHHMHLLGDHIGSLGKEYAPENYDNLIDLVAGIRNLDANGSHAQGIGPGVECDISLAEGRSLSNSAFGTIFHEFGHHLIHSFGPYFGYDYQDDGTMMSALEEGLANFFVEIGTRYPTGTYIRAQDPDQNPCDTTNCPNPDTDACSCEFIATLDGVDDPKSGPRDSYAFATEACTDATPAVGDLCRTYQNAEVITNTMIDVREVLDNETVPVRHSRLYGESAHPYPPGLLFAPVARISHPGAEFMAAEIELVGLGAGDEVVIADASSRVWCTKKGPASMTYWTSCYVPGDEVVVMLHSDSADGGEFGVGVTQMLHLGHLGTVTERIVMAALDPSYSTDGFVEWRNRTYAADQAIYGQDNHVSLMEDIYAWHGITGGLSDWCRNHCSLCYGSFFCP